MRYSNDQIAEMAAFYEEHGAVKLPGLVEPRWVEKVLGVIDAAAAASTGPGRVPGYAMSYGRGDGRTTIRYMWRENPTIREFLFRDELVEPLARITGCKELRFWFDLTFIHEAGAHGDAGAGSAWHHDIGAFSFKGEKLPSLWMAMTPATAANSRIEFIDGSHKTVPGFYRPPTEDSTFNTEMLNAPDFDELVRQGKEKVLTWDCAPGDAVIIHPYQIHGAKGNTGSKNHGRRVAITTRWLGDDVRWLPNNSAQNKVIGLDTPPPLGARPNGEWFPLVWSQSGVKDVGRSQ